MTINDDNECEEPAESFLSRLSYVSGQMPITIDPEEARVFIDDTDEPECAGRLKLLKRFDRNSKVIACQTGCFMI